MHSTTTKKIASCMAECARKDELEDGYDISSGVFGPNLSALIADIAFALDEDCSSATINNIHEKYKPNA